MIVAYVSVQTKAESEHEFERIIREIQTDILQLAGCVKNEWYRHPDIQGKFTIYNEFESHDHFDAYQKSNAVQRIVHELMPLLATPPHFKHYEATIFEEG